MTFTEILAMVCKDGIDVSYRDDAKQWVIARHRWLWGAKPWTFRNATGDITFTANSQSVAAADAPSDVHKIFAIEDQYGAPLRGIRDIRRFYDLFNTLADSSSGTPEAYTVVDGTILVGPKGDGSTGLIVYQKQLPTLSADGDETGLPDGYDLALVFGAKATGMKLTLGNQALAAEYDNEFTAAVQSLENDWLEAVLQTGGQVGAFRPDSWPAARY